MGERIYSTQPSHRTQKKKKTSPAHLILFCFLYVLPGVTISLRLYLDVPLDTEGSAHTAVDESLELMMCCLSHCPWFDPQRSTDFTLMINILNFVNFPVSLELQTSSESRSHQFVLCIFLTSHMSSCVTTMHAKEVKRSTYSRACPATATGLLLVCCIPMIFVLSLLMWRSILVYLESRCAGLYCICACLWTGAWVWVRRARSSVKSKSLSCDHSVHSTPFFQLL